MSKASSVLQLRVDESLKQAFSEAVRREHTTPSRALRRLMEDFVRASHRREAERQSRLVAAAPDAEETMAEVMHAQKWLLD